MKSINPVPKRLIICCDGTWQSSVSGTRNIPSNVTRLARTIAKAGQDAHGKQWQQIVYYDSGVGTGSLSWLEQARQGGTGDGLVVNVLEAYNFLVNNYNEGDQIFCFGFSRGAFTARCIAGLVTDIGIFKPDNMQAFAPLWAAYQKNTSKREFRKTKEYFQFVNGVRPMVEEGKENDIYVRQPYEIPHKDGEYTTGLTWPNSNVVEVVGCFDTVGSLGLSDTRITSHASSRRRFEYLNVKLSPFIKHAFHALALDEHREPFLPTLWYIPNEATLKAEEDAIDKEDDDWPALKAHRDEVDKQIKEHQATHKPDLYQVWFPGVHINIGGGSDEDSYDGEGLANVTFAWMIQQLGPYLAFEPWTWISIAGYQQRVIDETWRYGSMKKPTTVEKVENTVSEWSHWIFEEGKKKMGLSKEVKMVPVPEQNVRDPEPKSGGKDGKPIRWAISEYQDSYTRMYQAISGAVDRTPGECTDRSTEARRPLKELGRTNEYIHPSVWWRVKTMEGEKGGKQYNPSSLRDFERRQHDRYGSWGYKKGGLWIPEWFMKPTKDYMSRYAGGYGDGKDDEQWEHAEWTYTDNVDGTEELQKELAKFYLDAQEAEKKMKKDGREFPFGI